ncbi:Dynein-like protein [Spironucleus salmonicida]|uniref:Dynein-like protein n=1 Tax=Spironucleus salmonicida TaxID=348837 RepID=V6LSV3_9EUKA|nr:Dynein-like protein [Spironucleus salmonicida]|eukprot:EST47722.1 hypothetical protein SS50377_12120 [Spironucleus salmonicida]
MEYLNLNQIDYSGGIATNEPDGEGVMKIGDGTTYIGSFQSGKFHGDGQLEFPEGKIVGKWHNGELMEYQVFFKDGLQFEEEKWDYITPKDRRFYEETVGSVPVAASRVRVGQFKKEEDFRAQ